jgi:peptide-methionine (R)-S-oxide reductase
MDELTRRGFIFGTATIASYGVLIGVQRLCVSALAYDDQADADDSGPVTIVKFSDNGVRLGPATVAKIRRSTAEWKKQLTSLQYDVTRRAATEWAFTGAFHDQHSAGLYRCIDCDNALFDSSAKFDSGTGWPSFWKPIANENIYERSDTSFGAVRREVVCKLCDAHLGHVFTDGPPPTSLRFCMNSAALRFVSRRNS